MKVNEIKDLFPKFDVDTFEHVLGHVSKAAGKLHGLVGDADHVQEWRNGGRAVAFTVAERAGGKAARAYVADLVLCAAKLAALCPSGEFDLEEAIRDRMAEKRAYRTQYEGESW